MFVRGSCTHGRLGPPKSGLIRSVPLIDQAATALDALSCRDAFADKDDLVFCTALGGNLTDDTMRDGFYAALAAAGLGRGAKALIRWSSTTCGIRSGRSPSRRGRCMTCGRTWAAPISRQR